MKREKAEKGFGEGKGGGGGLGERDEDKGRNVVCFALLLTLLGPRMRKRKKISGLNK